MASYTWLQQKYGLLPEAAAIVEWQYHYTGDFKTALFECICLADTSNLQKLSRGFPIEVNGYLYYTRKPGWWQQVQKKIGKYD